MMDTSPGSGSIILRASLIMEKAVASLRRNTKQGNQDARDWCVRCLTLLDLLSTAGPNDGHGCSLGSAKIPHVDQLLTAAAAIENILSELSAMEAARQETDEHVVASNKKESNHPHSNISKSNDASPVPVISKEERIQISFNEVVGNLEAKQSLYENVILPLSISEATKVRVFSGIRAGSGNVMLYGPAGTGKTIMCQAAAYEAKAELIIVRPSDVLSKYHGESERYLRGVFERARTLPRAVIFFDGFYYMCAVCMTEFDAIAATRGGMQDSMSSRRLLSELLLQLTEQKQLQASDAQLLRLKLASARPPVKRTRPLKRPSDNENEDHSCGDTMDRGRKYARVVSASHSNGRQPQLDANCDPSQAEAGIGAAVGQRNKISAVRSNIRIDMDAEKGEKDFIIGTPLMRINTGRPVGHEDWIQSDEEVATEVGKEKKDEEEYEEGNIGRGVVIIAATNRLEDIDPAVVRRFESRVYVGVPEHDTRMAMVTAFLRGLDTVLNEQDLDTISSSTNGWSGSEIETLCREAAMAPVRAVWGYPQTVNKCNNAVTTCNSHSYCTGDRNKSSEGSMGSDKTLSASAHADNDDSDTIRPIELNDFLIGIDVMMKKGSD